MKSFLLEIIQIVLAVVILLSAYALRLMQNETYNAVKEYYSENINNSILVDCDNEV